MGALLRLQDYRDHEYAENLFGDVLEEIDGGRPPLPAQLQPYTYPASRSEKRAAGELLFVVWLAGELGGKLPAISTELRASCRVDDDSWRAFFPEEEGEDAELFEATALSICDDCPIRNLCLVSDQRAAEAEFEREHQKDRGGDGVRFHGIIGGFRADERTEINNVFHILRRSYRRFVRHGDPGRRTSAAEFADFERRARETIDSHGYIHTSVAS